MKKIMVFGAFDILHKGHKYFLKKAKEKGDFLVVVVGRDMIIKKTKGEFPIENEELRAKNLKGYADKVIMGDSKDFYKVIHEERPDLICLGYDQKAFVDGLKNMNVEIERLEPFKEHKYKSSIIKNLPKNE